MVDAGPASALTVSRDVLGLRRNPERREVVVVKPGVSDEIARERLTWSPPGVAAPLVIDLADVFGRS